MIYSRVGDGNIYLILNMMTVLIRRHIKIYKNLTLYPSRKDQIKHYDIHIYNNINSIQNNNPIAIVSNIAVCKILFLCKSYIK